MSCALVLHIISPCRIDQALATALKILEEQTKTSYLIIMADYEKLAQDDHSEIDEAPSAPPRQSGWRYIVQGTLLLVLVASLSCNACLGIKYLRNRMQVSNSRAERTPYGS